MSLINKWVCVSSGVHNDHLYVFQVEFETKTTVGFVGRFKKEYFKKDCIFTISDNKEECQKLRDEIEQIDKQCTELQGQRRKLLQQTKNNLRSI